MAQFQLFTIFTSELQKRQIFNPHPLQTTQEWNENLHQTVPHMLACLWTIKTHIYIYVLRWLEASDRLTHAAVTRGRFPRNLEQVKTETHVETFSACKYTYIDKVFIYVNWVQNFLSQFNVFLLNLFTFSWSNLLLNVVSFFEIFCKKKYRQTNILTV